MVYRAQQRQMDPKVVQYTLAVFYLFAGVLIVVLAFTIPQITTSASLIFGFVGIFVIIAAIMQLVSIPQFVELAQRMPENASIDDPPK